MCLMENEKGAKDPSMHFATDIIKELEYTILLKVNESNSLLYLNMYCFLG